MTTPLRKSLWWYKLCWVLVVLTIGAALLRGHGTVAYVLCFATAFAGTASATYLEQVKPTIVTDFIWFIVPGALLLFPLALAIHSVRIYRLCRMSSA